ncbi:MAG: hypothetical protein JNK12_13050 [Acidimicrobiales bacterium]|nr:hypothetical protein [Acidimicrobiales bacterium]
MALSQEHVSGFTSLPWLPQAFINVVAGSGNDVAAILQQLADSDSFWDSWDQVIRNAEPVPIEILDDNTFLAQEIELVHDLAPNLSPAATTVLQMVIEQAAEAASRVNRFPDGQAVRARIRDLAEQLDAEQVAGEPNSPSWLRSFGRAVSVLAGATIVMADVPAVAGGGIPALASFPVGMAGIAAGTFDDPAAARDFLRARRPR